MNALMLADLTEYPQLASVYDVDFRRRYSEKNEAAPDLLWTVLCDPSPVADPYRQEFDTLVAEGLRSGLLGNEMRGRLRSSSAEQRYGAVSELEVGRFLSERGFAWLPRPRGRGTRCGDIQLHTHPPAFVEVKAILDRPIEVIEQFISRKLWRVTEMCVKQVNRPLLVQTMIYQVAPDFDGRHYRRWLLRHLSADAPLPRHARYAGRAGLVLDIEVIDSPLTSRESAQIQTPPAHWVQTASYVRHSLENSYRQLPDDGRVCITILRPHLAFKPDTDDMLGSLYGTEQWIVSMGPEPRCVGAKRAPDGFFSPNAHRRVSAAALLKAVRTETGTDLTLDVYHNPFARYPLDWRNLAGAAIRHFVLGDDGTMAWTEPHD